MAEVKEVFICYARRSSEAAKAIVAALEEAGISCWIDERDAPMGEDYKTAINHAIKDCRVFLFVIDKNSVKSPHVVKEVALAFERINREEDIRLAPIKTEECDIPDNIAYDMTNRHTLDCIPPTPENIQAVTREIDRRRIRRRGPKASPP